GGRGPGRDRPTWWPRSSRLAKHRLADDWPQPGQAARHWLADRPQLPGGPARHAASPRPAPEPDQPGEGEQATAAGPDHLPVGVFGLGRRAPAPEPPPAEPALGRRTSRALLWSFLNNVVGRVGSSLTAIVLARLLVPADYGVYAVALVALSALLSLNELGVSLAAVRWAGSVDRIPPTLAPLPMAR